MTTYQLVGLIDRTIVGRGRVPEGILQEKGRYDLLGKKAAKAKFARKKIGIGCAILDFPSIWS